MEGRAEEEPAGWGGTGTCPGEMGGRPGPTGVAVAVVPTGWLANGLLPRGVGSPGVLFS